MSREERIFEKLKIVVEDPGNMVGVDKETDLLETGVLTSLEMALLIPALEEEFSIEEIDIEDVIPENFTSVQTISELIRRYLPHEC